MTRDEVAEKCYGVLAPVVGRKRTGAVIEAIWTIERIRVVRSLRPLCVVDRGSVISDGILRCARDQQHRWMVRAYTK
jgi:hypothetical protein